MQRNLIYFLVNDHEGAFFLCANDARYKTTGGFLFNLIDGVMDIDGEDNVVQVVIIMQLVLLSLN